MAIALAAALPLLLCGAADADPSVDDILSALKPKPGSLNGTTRGIRAIAPTGAAPSGTAPVRRATTVAPAADDGPPSLDLNVVFRSGSADLSPSSESMLAKLGKALDNPSLASYRFRIEGHTDTVGTPEQNKALSQARAEKVASFLESRYGVAPDRLEAVGMGEEGLLVPTPDQTAEIRNRRVHVVNLGG
jgi:outer membrane protein OmpA-like peptidoglycan-associated protein